MTVKEIFQLGREMLTQSGVPDADYDAFCLLSFVTGCDRSFFLTYPDHCMSPDQADKYLDLCGKRAGRIPLQHLTGSQGFYGLDFEVGPDVLIPRYDTEVLVETVLSYAGNMIGGSIIDVGTGSGCILVTLLRELTKRGNWSGIGLDLSDKALAVARKNARKHGVDDKTEWLRSDLFAMVKDKKAEIIVSNPPYIPTSDINHLMAEVRDHDPHLALDGGCDGLDIYRRLIPEAYERLQTDGLLAVEIGASQAPPVTELFRTSGYTQITVTKDLSGLDRVVSGLKKSV